MWIFKALLNMGCWSPLLDLWGSGRGNENSVGEERAEQVLSLCPLFVFNYTVESSLAYLYT